MLQPAFNLKIQIFRDVEVGLISQAMTKKIYFKNVILGCTWDSRAMLGRPEQKHPQKTTTDCLGNVAVYWCELIAFGAQMQQFRRFVCHWYLNQNGRRMRGRRFG